MRAPAAAIAAKPKMIPNFILKATNGIRVIGNVFIQFRKRTCVVELRGHYQVVDGS